MEPEQQGSVEHATPERGSAGEKQWQQSMQSN